MIRLTLFLGGLIACATLSAQQAPTTKSLMEEVSALKQRVAALELRLAKLEARPEPPRPPSEPLAFDRPKSSSENTKGIIGNIKSYAPGHELNFGIIKEIFSSDSNYEISELDNFHSLPLQTEVNHPKLRLA